MITKCFICKKEFVVEGLYQKYCSKKCREKAKDRILYPEMVRYCEVCGEEFRTAKSTTTTCSSLCSQEKNRKKGLERYRRMLKGEISPNYKGLLKLRFYILQRDNFTCQYCGRTPQDGAKLEIDHIIPRKKGGKTYEGNLTTSCWECNQGKKDFLLEERKRRKYEKNVDRIGV